MPERIPAIQIDPKTAGAALHADSRREHETTDLYERRKKIYVKKVLGFFQRIRTFTLYFFMGAYFLTCWISIDGQQLVHFDLPERQFHIFGATFWPQDFALLAAMLIIAAFGLFFVTTLFGRVWCGYTCPQTVWTFIFIWLEEKFEGSRNARMKLDQQPWTREKVVKKGLTHTSWLLVALATGLTFVGYFYPVRELVPDFFTLSVDSGWAYFWIAFFTVATYLNAGWLREQVCIYMCPYARFQSVMFDQDTLTVAYDPVRGEPRSGRKKSLDHKAVGLGDCIDCGMCVQVCPTGIDIRDGLQYECIGCAKCIDACDNIMDRMGYDPGLIRYATERELNGKQSRLIRARTIGYGLALTAMLAFFAYFIMARADLALDVLRDRGSLYKTAPSGFIENAYLLQVSNKTDVERRFRVEVSGDIDFQISGKTSITVPPAAVASLPVAVEVDPETIRQSTYELEFALVSDETGDAAVRTQSTFLGPIAR
ncbi:MAG: cytochrome c oxidase accessory protein CcoG [unclassified Hahellaceae]|nr:cytochrome c oxidase accessory protein CcoG [Hahellaceae bacterium]|tara:strand:+ start:100043 stop:101491 length:1449 start_codon:yes stop_codon:yes gene_type:complete